MRLGEVLVLLAVLAAIYVAARVDIDDTAYCARLGLEYSRELGTCVKVAKKGGE